MIQTKENGTSGTSEKSETLTDILWGEKIWKKVNYF
jgi:hypothetical protein